MYLRVVPNYTKWLISKFDHPNVPVKSFALSESPNSGRIVGGDEIEVVEIEPQLSTGQKEELPPPVPIDARVVIEVNSIWKSSKKPEVSLDVNGHETNNASSLF